MKHIAQRSLVGLTLLGSGLVLAEDLPTTPTQYTLPAPTGGMGPLSVPGVQPPPVNMPTPVEMAPPYGPTMSPQGAMPLMSPPFMGPMPGTIGPNYGPGGPYGQAPGMVNPG
ncbi:MAG TPA: hypothetical protein VHB77_09570, partial [Planctomycetaceae bacterium]|nr:hypothetical protein [Planctomycetaceae bacterium]